MGRSAEGYPDSLWKISPARLRKFSEGCGCRLPVIRGFNHLSCDIE